MEHTAKDGLPCSGCGTRIRMSPQCIARAHARGTAGIIRCLRCGPLRDAGGKK